MQRDLENNLKLKELGFLVMRFWEKEIKQDIKRCVEKVVDHLVMRSDIKS